MESAKLPVPQSWNRYSYVINNPLNLTDPTGMDFNIKKTIIDGVEVAQPEYVDCFGCGDWAATYGYVFQNPDGVWTALNPFENEGASSAYATQDEAIQAFNGYKQQAAINVTAGYVSELSMVAGIGSDALGVANRNSSMYALGQKAGSIISKVSIGVGGLGASTLVDKGLGLIGRFIRGAQGADDVLREAKQISNCFVAGTPIQTETGIRPIEEIKSGDKVLSWNEHTHQVEYKPVVRTFINHAGELLEITVEGEEKPIVTTLGHPFFVHRARDNTSTENGDEGDWILSKSLRVSDEVRLLSGRWVSILNIEKLEHEATVYNFEVADNHNYFVAGTGILVHNQSQLVEGEAGRFADLSARGTVGDNLTPHHMPQAAMNFTSRADGGALVMTQGEHALTRTFAGRGRILASAERGLPFRTLLMRDIRDVRSITGNRYNQGLLNLIDYYRTNFPNLIAK
jgi:hypothetical protein